MGLLVNTMRTEGKMDETQIREQIEGLRHMTVGQLKEKYLEASGETSRSNHKAVPVPAGRLAVAGKRLGWPVGTSAEAGVGDRQRRLLANPRAEEFSEGRAGPEADSRKERRAVTGRTAADSRHDATDRNAVADPPAGRCG
jgi:hypothetical protein